MWTPSVQSDDYWFRLKYDTQTARFEDITPMLLEPSTNKSLESCLICDYFRQNEKRGPRITDNGFTFNGENYQVRIAELKYAFYVKIILFKCLLDSVLLNILMNLNHRSLKVTFLDLFLFMSNLICLLSNLARVKG
jgi:hypothetical protein